MRTFLATLALAFGMFCLSATPAAAQFYNNNTQMGNGYFLPVVPQHQQPFLPPPQQPRPYHGRGIDGNDLRDSAGMIAGAIILGAVIDRSQQPQFDPRMYQQRQNCCAQGGHHQRGHAQQAYTVMQPVTVAEPVITPCGPTPPGFACEVDRVNGRIVGMRLVRTH